MGKNTFFQQTVIALITNIIVRKSIKCVGVGVCVCVCLCAAENKTCIGR